MRSYISVLQKQGNNCVEKQGQNVKPWLFGEIFRNGVAVKMLKNQVIFNLKYFSVFKKTLYLIFIVFTVVIPHKSQAYEVNLKCHGKLVI